MAEYQMEIHHRPGCLMLDTDPLSQVLIPPSEEPLTWGLQDELDTLDQQQCTLHITWASLTEEPYVSIGAFLAGESLDHLDPVEHRKIRHLAPHYFLSGPDLMKRTPGSCPCQFVPPHEH